MLGENFGGVIDTSVMFALNGSLKDEHGKPKQAAGFDSNIVTDTGQWVTLGELMSEDFMTRVRTVTGISNVDLFCGSGSGGWKEPTKPGEGEFTCNNVRVMIDKVEPTDPEVRKAMAASGTLKLQEQANKDRVTAAQQLYGDQWAWVLGVQDTIEKCQANDKQVCVINVGSGNVTVPVPTRG